MSTSYKAPLDDMRFILHDVLDVVGTVSNLPAFKDAAVDADSINLMLKTAADFSEKDLIPLNEAGDTIGSVHDKATKTVTTPPGYKEAFAKFCDNSLMAAGFPMEYGGLGLPDMVGAAMNETYCSGNIDFAMFPCLTMGHARALIVHGSQEIKDELLPLMAAGKLLATMDLTEPGVGSDLARLITHAKDGKIDGTKIFISGGDHDLNGPDTNIAHLVLARTDEPSGSKGIKGISLFSVLKFLPDADGKYTIPNTLYAASIEEKQGLHASPTCEMVYSDAEGRLVGKLNEGVPAMFVMMGEARLGVGLQGLGQSELAYQNAVEYARTRLQGTDIGISFMPGDKPAVAIIKHPAVADKLMTMKSETEGARMLNYWAYKQQDIAHHHPDAAARKQAQDLLDFITPIVKAHLTDNVDNHARLGQAIYGGHGFIRHHGMELISRNVRILQTWEGTNDIQGNDLLFRKTIQKGLATPYALGFAEDLQAAQATGLAARLTEPVAKAMMAMTAAADDIKNRTNAAEQTLRASFAASAPTLMEDVKKMSDTMRDDAADAIAFRDLASVTAMGHMWMKMATAAQQKLNNGAGNKDFYQAKLDTADYYMKAILAPRIAAAVTRLGVGAAPVMALKEEAFVHGQGNVAMAPRPPSA